MPVQLERAGSWGAASPSTPLGPGPEAPSGKCSFACYAANTRRRNKRVLVSPHVEFWVGEIRHLPQRILSFTLVAISRMPEISHACISGNRSSWRAPSAYRWSRLPSWRQTPLLSRGGLPPWPREMSRVPGRGAGLCKLFPGEYYLYVPL